jgi:transposase
MQTKRERLDYGMTLLPPLEQLLPDDHPIRRLDQVLDLSFIHKSVRDRYCQDNGRPSVDPEVVIRLFLIQALNGISSVRQLMREVQVNLAYRWFIGYRIEEKLPDHSTLSRALDRIGDAVFDDVFKRSVQQCHCSGLIEGKVLHVDATTIRADLDANRVNQPDSPDKDARFGRFPGGKTKPGYKQHTLADGKKRVVLGVSVTPANSPDDTGMVEMVDDVAECLDTSPVAVCADAAYGSGRNRAALETRGVRLVSPPPKVKTHTGDKYFTVEDFEYDEANDEFVCPAGKKLSFVAADRERPDRRKYRAWRSHCGVCELKAKCTRTPRRQLKVGVHHASLIRLRADSKTESFRMLYRSRAPVIEGVFAEAKQWHGLGRAWRRGLAKMRVQCLLVAAVINFKRLATVSGGLYSFRVLFTTIIDAIRRILNESNSCRSPLKMGLLVT